MIIICTYWFLIDFCLTPGVVTSPNYPNNYPNNLQQTNTIEVEEGLIVEMQFTAFDVESHSTCSYDYVTIKNGDGTTLMEKTCGSSLPAAITSKSNIVEIYFHTDRKDTESGWRLTWRAVTPGVFLLLCCVIFFHHFLGSVCPGLTPPTKTKTKTIPN